MISSGLKVVYNVHAIYRVFMLHLSFQKDRFFIIIEIHCMYEVCLFFSICL